MRTYSVTFDNVSVSAVQDLFTLIAASNKPCYLLGYEFSQTLHGDVGDAKEEMLRIKIGRGLTAAGSAGTTPTPVPMDSSVEAAAGLTAHVNDTTQATTGTEVVIANIAFNARVGAKEWYPPEARPGFNSSGLLRFALLSAPANALTLSGTVYVAEAG